MPLFIGTYKVYDPNGDVWEDTTLFTITAKDREDALDTALDKIYRSWPEGCTVEIALGVNLDVIDT